MYYFEMSNFWKKFYYKRIQSNLLDPERCLVVFRSISQTFIMKNQQKLVLQSRMHYFGVPNFLKKFCHERIQSNLLDPKRCYRVFRSIRQNFGTKMMQNLCFRVECTSSRYRTSEFFCHKRIQSNLLHPK